MSLVYSNEDKSFNEQLTKFGTRARGIYGIQAGDEKTAAFNEMVTLTQKNYDKINIILLCQAWYDIYKWQSTSSKNKSDLKRIKLPNIKITIGKVRAKDNQQYGTRCVIPLIIAVIKLTTNTYAGTVQQWEDKYKIFEVMDEKQKVEELKKVGDQTETNGSKEAKKYLEDIDKAYKEANVNVKLDEELGISLKIYQMDSYNQLFRDTETMLNVVVNEREEILFDAKKVGVLHFLKNLYIKSDGMTPLKDGELTIDDEEDDNKKLTVLFENADITESIKDKTLMINPLIDVKEIEKLSNQLAIAYKNAQLEVLQNKYPYMNHILD